MCPGFWFLLAHWILASPRCPSGLQIYSFKGEHFGFVSSFLSSFLLLHSKKLQSWFRILWRKWTDFWILLKRLLDFWILLKKLLDFWILLKKSLDFWILLKKIAGFSDSSIPRCLSHSLLAFRFSTSCVACILRIVLIWWKFPINGKVSCLLIKHI